RVRVLYVARGVGRHERVDDAWIRERYGIPAAAYADFATLRGDPSDGLPGVKGVGEKTAAVLLTDYGDLEGILAAAQRPQSRIAPGLRSKLTAAVDYLGPAREVVRVARDLELAVGWDDLAVPSAPVRPERFTQLRESLG